jgi:phospholipid/cholesterol/gamma-HCH transport system substrate-binding protein
MKSTIRRRAVIVGLFLFFGLVILMIGILTVGNLHNSFVKKFILTTIFDEVNGLQPGNNIWFSGVKIGTVQSLDFYGKSQVKVSMRIDRKAQSYIRKDAKAKISTDGFIGNKIIVIYGGNDSVAAVTDGDRLVIEKTLSTDDMLKTLQENNLNLLSITNDIKVISKRIMNGEGTLGKLLADESLYDNLGQTVAILKNAAGNAERLTASISDYGSKLNQKGSLTNDLVSDTIVFNTIKATVLELKQIASTAAELTANLKNASTDLNNSNSPVGVLLHDQPAAADLKSTIKNLEISTQKLNEDLEALQHNFLFRGYFRKKAKDGK